MLSVCTWKLHLNHDFAYPIGVWLKCQVSSDSECPSARGYGTFFKVDEFRAVLFAGATSKGRKHDAYYLDMPRQLSHPWVRLLLNLCSLLALSLCKYGSSFQLFFVSLIHRSGQNYMSYQNLKSVQPDLVMVQVLWDTRQVTQKWKVFLYLVD